MRNTARLAKSPILDRLTGLTGRSTRNHPGSVGVAVVGVRTRQTTECRLVGTVPLGDVAALEALAAGVPGVDKDHRDTIALRLVGHEQRQLAERPTAENLLVACAQTYPRGLECRKGLPA